MKVAALRRILAEEGLIASGQEADKLDAKAEAEEDQAEADRAKADADRMAALGSPEEIEKQRKSLKRLDRKALEREYKRHHRVSDTRELSKGDLVFGILRARHGQKRLDAWSKRASDTVAQVITYGGRAMDFDRDEIQEMLDYRRMYEQSDNLPKWLFVAGAVDGVRGFPKTFQQVWRYIEKLVDHKGRPVVINVRSDDRSKNTLPRL